MNKVFRNFPPLPDLIPVYSVITVMAYGWTLVAALWVLPSWALFLTVSEIFSLFAYIMTASLFESLVAIGALALTAAILPARWLKEDFVVRGTWLTIVLYSAMMIFHGLNSGQEGGLVRFWNAWTLAAIAVAVMAVRLAGRLSALRGLARWLSDQLTVFLYLLLPLSLVSLLVVIGRNLF